MTGNQLRDLYLQFFRERGHAVIPSAPIVLANDPTTLFTSSGMQPMMPYLLGQNHPLGARLADSQKSFRSGDIEEVGDNRHTTFFEMLGNWSLGDYFKKEQLPWFWEFLTTKVGLDPQKLYVTVFSGDEQNRIPKDQESIEIWQQIFASSGINASYLELHTEEAGYQQGMGESRIFGFNAAKNWWSRAGVPSNMPAGEPGGPDSEVFYDFGTPHDPKFGKHCHPNCDCGRFMEIGNSVFMLYQKQSDGSIKELSQKNVDFGGGFERILAAKNNHPDVFLTDLFYPVIKSLQEITGKTYQDNLTSFRIIVDHFKGSVMMISEGLEPSNKQQGYLLRRLLRRASLKLFKLKDNFDTKDLSLLIKPIFDLYEGVYLDTDKDLDRVVLVIKQEVEKFRVTLQKGLKVLEKADQIDGKLAFGLLSTYGFPWELTLEIAQEKNQKPNRKAFETEFKKHQDLSRSSSTGMFKGGLADHSETVTKYHTATHLLQKALRDILGDHVHQAGSNLTGERLRFDFTHPTSLTTQELERVENLVNQYVDENLPVTFETLPYEEAIKSGALAFFKEKYPDHVTVYSIGQISKELCGGPHVSSTGQIGKIKVVKQESLGQSLRRLYLKLAQ